MSGFTVAQDKAALLNVQDQGRLSETALKMLLWQCQEPHHRLTAKRLGTLMGWTRANLDHGAFGKKSGARLEGLPPEDFRLLPEGWRYLSSGHRDGEFHRTMRPELATALAELSWVEASVVLEPEFGELPTQQGYRKGATRQVVVNAYERNSAARQAALTYHGTICAVCDSDLEEFYGPIASGFIHVHHLTPLSETRGAYAVNPQTDLVPVCPNCHAMLHRREPPLTVQELRNSIQEAHR